MRIMNASLCEKVNQIQLFLLRYSRVEVDKSWEGENINSPFSFLYYVIRGKAVIQTEHEQIELTAGRWYLLPSRNRFLYRCDDCFDHLSFHIKLCRDDRLDLLHMCRRPLSAAGELPELLLENLTETDNMLKALQVRKCVYDIVLSMLEENGISLDPVRYSLPVSRAIEYIGSHLSARLTTEEIAKEIFISKSTLTKHFRKELSMSVKEYLCDILLSEANRMLLTEKCSVLEISEALGFSDQFYFSKRFRAKFGKSPREYRKSNLL